MYQQERVLQRLRQRYQAWLPWLSNATKATVTISSSGNGNGFIVVARWGSDGEYKKLYDAAAVLRQGRVGCVKDYARAFVAEVLTQRGVL